jgi:two-component system chemotaxis sensor kinase CheA
VNDRFDANEFIGGFIAETEDHLSSATANLLSAERPTAEGQATPRQVRELFRALHTVKGLAGMVGVDAVVEIAHAMEAVLREADRAAGLLSKGSIEPLLAGVQAIERCIRALAKGAPVPSAPPQLIAALDGLRRMSAPHSDTSAGTSLPPDLASKLSPAEREQLSQGLAHGRSARLVRFLPTPARAAAGITITSVRERLGAVAEIVKVVPESVPTSSTAPGGLSFAIVALTDADDATIAAAADTTPEALVAVALAGATPMVAAPTIAAEVEPAADELGRRGVVRVEVSRLDDALEKLSAVVTTQFRLARAMAALRAAGADVRDLAQVLAENARQVRDLRAAIMRARMVSVSEMLERIPLLVRGLTRATGKEVRLELDAGRAELDKTVAERIFPAVVHLVRNAVDHALETPDERQKAGKPAAGLVRVTCHERSDNQLELSIADDGRGVDAAAVARRAGATLPATPEALLELLVRPGLSTKTEVTTTSGRGMGMDVVKRVAVEELRGQMSMTTERGGGTTFTLRIPLSITIIDAFSFQCGGEMFVVPVAMVEEIQDVDVSRMVRGPDRRKVPRGAPDRRRAARAVEMIQRRGEAVPVLRLDELLGLPAGEAARPKAIVVRRNGDPFAFTVDRVLGRQEIVVKPLEDALVRVGGISGTTDLGDGKPTLVLDLAALGGKLVSTDAEGQLA